MFLLLVWCLFINLFFRLSWLFKTSFVFYVISHLWKKVVMFDSNYRIVCADVGKDVEPVVDGGYRAVAFSYGNLDEATEQKNSDVESVFHPPFPVPESLVPNLVSSFC